MYCCVFVDDLGKALISTEVDGLFHDLLRMFLGTLFQLQIDEEEDEETSSVKGVCVEGVGVGGGVVIL